MFRITPFADIIKLKFVERQQNNEVTKELTMEKERQIEKIVRILRLIDTKMLHLLYITALNML